MEIDKETWLDRWQDRYHAYKLPIFCMWLNHTIYFLFGVTNECGRNCPMPEMTDFEHFLFMIAFPIDLVCIGWVAFIHWGRKYRDNEL